MDWLIDTMAGQLTTLEQVTGYISQLELNLAQARQALADREADCARLRGQAGAWVAVWKALYESFPSSIHGPKNGVDTAVDVIHGAAHDLADLRQRLEAAERVVEETKAIVDRCCGVCMCDEKNHFPHIEQALAALGPGERKEKSGH